MKQPDKDTQTPDEAALARALSNSGIPNGCTGTFPWTLGWVIPPTEWGPTIYIIDEHPAKVSRDQEHTQPEGDDHETL